MKEELLHFVWKYQLFEKRELTTTSGETVEIIQQGIHNFDAGPDFLQAKIKIGQQIWAGNIEIHVQSSEWFNHGHQNNPAYKNVILHLVYEDDMGKNFQNKTKIPVLSLKYRINRIVIENYHQMMSNTQWIACEDSIHLVDSLTWQNWLQRLLTERLEYKLKYIDDLLLKYQNDIHECLFISIARSFGYRVNADAFEKLAQITPQKIIARHKNSLFQIEALLFGQAGLLDQKFTDEYPLKLQREYEFLASKYNLVSMDSTEWKYARLRPPNFPTIRIAQFAQLLYKSSSLLNKITNIKQVDEIFRLFNTETSPYWHNHFTFDQITENKARKKTGKNLINRIIINSVIPIIFYYGKDKNEQELTQLAFDLFEKIEPEKNSILDKWTSLGIANKNSADSQALIHLKNYYCEQKKCLSCSAGTFILKKQK